MKKSFARFFLLIIINTACVYASFAQEKEQIIIKNSDALLGGTKIGEGVRRFIGNVIFEHNNATMYCDSAYLYSQQNLIHAFSNVHISRGDTLHMYGDFMLYNGNTSIGNVRNNIRLEDEKTILYTDSLDFNTATNIAHYFDGGRIVNTDSSELISKHGYYFSNQDLFIYKDNVVVTATDYIIYTDSLRYNSKTKIMYFIGPTNIYNGDNHLYAEKGWYKTNEEKYKFTKNARYQNKEKILLGDVLYYDQLNGIGRANDNIEIIDTVEKMILKGNYAYYVEEPESFFITDSALLIHISENNDSLFLHADTISSISVTDSIDTYRILKAFHKVKMFRSDFQGRCDSMVYNTRDSVASMFVEPILWSEGSQMTALKVEAYIKNEKIDRFKLINTAFIISQEEIDTANYNQIKGKEMTGYIRNNELKKIDVVGNGQTIYYTEDGSGVNAAESSNLVIYMNNGKVGRINMINDPEGVLYPMGELQETRLKGFLWLEKLRPKKKEDIFNTN
jgi:lipopolysaccharide export system protein LptA